MSDIFTTTPQHVNKHGVKFWLDKELTLYARGKGLSSVHVLFVEETSGYRTRLVVQDGVPIFEHTGLENVAVHLDMMALAGVPAPSGGEVAAREEGG